MIMGMLLAVLNTAASCSKKSNPDTLGEVDAQPDEAPSLSPGTKLVKKVPTLDDLIVPEDLSKSTKLPITLKRGKPLPEDGAEGLTLAKTSQLSKAATDTLLARMEPLVTEAGDKVDFAKRERSLPPPKTGEVVSTAFPPPSSLEAPDVEATTKSTPLEVLRHAPDGEVAIAPQVSITFNQPMVAVSSIAEINAENLPVTLSPDAPGQWRWVGAKTLLFEPDHERLPMATEYTLKVKEGTTSKLGQALDDTAPEFSFKTPPVKVTRFWPDNYQSQPRDPLMFMTFDQRIDQETILEHIKIKGGMVFGTRNPVLATPEQIAESEQLAELVANAEDGQWVAFKADTELPYDANISVTLKKGAASAEGPLLTTEAQSYDFRTFGPLKINEARCGWGSCTPSTPFYFTLSNTLKEGQEFEELVTIEPSFPGMSISNYGNSITVQGAKPGRRDYKVTFSDEIEDVHGQKLAGKLTYTFNVGAENPWMSETGGTLAVLDPSSDPSYTIFTNNIDTVSMKVYEVSPADWGAYLEWKNDWGWRGKHAKSPPGKKIATRDVAIKGELDTMTQTLIDLKKELGEDGLGNLVLEITPTKASEGSTLGEKEYRPRIRKWVQRTQIGLDAFVDGEDLLAWATTLKNGEPMSGVELTLANITAPQKSDDKGMTSFALKDSTSVGNNYLLAKKGKDMAFLPEYQWANNYTSWVNRPGYNNMQLFVFDDRGMYRPGEEVHIKGIARVREDKKGGDLLLPGDESRMTLNYVVYGPMGNEITKGIAPVTGLGGFDFKLTLPGTPNLGQARVNMTLTGGIAYGSHDHYFQIQEFRRPEFQVSTTAPEGPFLAGEEASVTVSASYYAGGALPNADTTWTVTTTQASFTPPNQNKYTFGSWVPWWARGVSSNDSETKTFQAKTDVTGEDILKLAFGLSDPPRPMNINAQATVMDVNRQASTSSTSLLVHPSAHYVGMRSEKYFVKKGEPLEIKAVVSDIDGNLLADRPVKVRAARVKWTWKDGQYKEELVDPQDCEEMTRKDETTCTFKTDVGGTYKIIATTLDDYGRKNFSEMTRWVSGGDRPVSRNVEQEKVEMIPDRDTYQPRDTARILVQSPFVPAEGLMMIQRNGIVEERRFTMSESTTTLEVPIKSLHVPNLHVQVNLVGSAPRLNEDGEADESLPRRPAFAQGALNLPVPPRERTLSVKVLPEVDRIEPAGVTTVTVDVKDAEGKALKDAEVAIVVVDESILSLSSYMMADPVSFFYPTRPSGVSNHHLRTHLLLVDPAALRAQNAQGATGAEQQRVPPRPKPSKKMKGRAMAKKDELAAAPAQAERAPGGALGMADSMDFKMSANMEMDDAFAGVDGVKGGEGGGGNGQAATPIAVRSNFNPLASFSPSVRTNAKGQAIISVEMPDNLTRYRIMAVAVDGAKRFGHGESNITARLPLMVRPSAPRFLNFGDKFELPVVLQNQTDEPMDVQVATRASNVHMASAQGYTVSIPANDRVEVRFPATTEQAGTARFQVAASAGKWNDAATFELPVWTPATSEAFATYGVIDKGVMVQPVKTPGEVWPQFGQLEVTTSSTALQSLTDAFLYLYHYDYQCAEQISSRMISVAALRDVLTAFKAEGMPDKKAVTNSMNRDIEELISRQNSDGGFGLWRRGQPSWPYVSLHAAHALTRAEQKGYKVDAYAKRRMLSYLTNIESYIPYYYSKYTRDHISAYALYVRGLNSDRDTAKARALIKGVKDLEELSFESLGWLLGVLTGDPDSASQIKELKRFINNRVTETAGAAHFGASIGKDQGYLIMHSSRNADAIILEAMMDDEPKSDLIPKIVKGLLAHKKKGRWSNTQENAFVLLALDKYFNIYEKETPDFVSRVWLGDVYAGDHTYKGRTTEQHQIDIPMSYLADQPGKEKPLIIKKDGKKGRMYYRVGMTYAPKDLHLDPMDQGFVVERTYEPVDNDDDVKRLVDGTWEIKAGAKVRIKLTMVAPTRRYHVALVDPLPAGLETLNPALATTEDLPTDPAQNTGRGGWWWWSRPWFEHQNMRDERTEAFTTMLWGGVHTYTYYARATTPGEFVVPPTKAEEMYSPETFGRSGTDRVNVVD